MVSATGIGTDKDDDLYAEGFYDEHFNFFHKHSLSRNFCNFMSRYLVTDGEPELDQIGSLLGIDISPLYHMEYYADEVSAESQLSLAETEQERKEILQQIEADRNRIKNNIDVVLHTIERMHEQLSGISDLHKKLDDHGDDTLGYENYFTDFTIDKGNGSTHNNFGHDLRNFKRFLRFAKSKGATTVWFDYDWK